MNLVKTVKCKLQVSPEQAEVLQATLRAFAEACNYTLNVALERNIRGRYSLHRLVYSEIRSRFSLSANLACQAIRRVADAIKSARAKGKRPRHFEPKSVAYDQRIFAFREKDWSVSITTVQGRLHLPLRVGGYQKGLLKGQSPKAATLTYDKFSNRYYIHIVLEKPVEPPNPQGFVGVDLNHHPMIAASNGFVFFGTKFLRARRHFAQLRQDLQRKGTHGARKTLRRLSGKERRHIRHDLHVATRNLVDSLEPGTALVFEDLTYIRERARVRKSQRHQHQTWPFYIAQSFAAYKALAAGHSILFVDPRKTSQVCPRCGYTARANRKSTKLFRCTSCGFQHNSWSVAARNIACRAGSASPGPSGERYTALRNPALNQRASLHS